MMSGKRSQSSVKPTTYTRHAPGSSSSARSISSEGFHGLHSSIFRRGMLGHHKRGFCASFSSLMILSSYDMRQSAMEERKRSKSGAHNLRQDTGEPHQMILVHVAMEQITVWRRFDGALRRANVSGIERGTVWIQHTQPKQTSATNDTTRPLHTDSPCGSE